MAARGEISKATVKHWDRATGKKKLPKRVGKGESARRRGVRRRVKKRAKQRRKK